MDKKVNNGIGIFLLIIVAMCVLRIFTPSITIPEKQQQVITIINWDDNDFWNYNDTIQEEGGMYAFKKYSVIVRDKNDTFQINGINIDIDTPERGKLIRYNADGKIQIHEPGHVLGLEHQTK